MATKQRFTYMLIFVLLTCNVVAQEMELRVLPSGQNTLRWEFTNASPFSIGTPRDFFGGDNNFIAARPKRSASGWSEEMVFGPVYDREATPPPIIIPPEAGRIEYVDKMTFPGLIAFFYANNYLRCRWWMRDKFTQHIILGCATDGCSMKPPYVGTVATNATAHIAFVFNEPEPNDLAFVYLNGSNSTNNIASPLSSESSLVVTSPSIGYSNEVTSAAYASTNALVAPRMAEHWRIPWPDVWGRIPVEDRERLRMAGKIDLRWKCGDIVSDPLPLWVGSLDDMTNNPYATGEM